MAKLAFYLIASKVRELLLPSERRDALWVIGLMFVGMVVETAGVGLIVPVIATLTHADLSGFSFFAPLGRWLSRFDRAEVAVLGMAALLAVYSAKAAVLAWLTWRQTRFAYQVQEALSRRLFRVYLHQPYEFFLTRNSAHLIANVVTETYHFTIYAVMPMMTIAAEFMVLAGLAALLVALEPVGAFFEVVALGGAAWLFHRITRVHLARWGAARQHHEALRIQHLQQGLGGIKEVKTLGCEGEFLRQYQFHNQQSAKASRLHSVLQQLPRLWLELLAVAGLVILVITMVWRGRDVGLLLPTLSVFAAAAFRLIPSVNRILGATQSLRYGAPILDLLHRELRLPCVAPQGAVEALEFKRMLELRSVSYTYPSAHTSSLNEVSLSICRGECVGFVGASGAGKSTLIDIILGLLPPTSGSVLVDGVDIQHHVRSWRAQIGYVPQSTFLTDDTLKNNVALGIELSQVDEGKVHTALKAAQLGELVDSWPNGIETNIGERGMRLSGGQRQRIAIARALYHGPAVLVLDEATSALDSATEREITDVVEGLRGKTTVLIVAHRVSTLARCDRIYELKDGSVSLKEDRAGAPSFATPRHG